MLVDVWEFEEAIRAHQWAVAAGHYKGPLLDGFHFADSRELETWIDTERARLRREYQAAIEFLANIAAEAGDHSQSVTWLRRLANSDPLSAGPTKRLMLALAAAGDRAGAVKHARLIRSWYDSLNETGEFEIYVVPFPNTGAAKWAISTGGGTGPLWSHRGSELFYRDASQHLVAIKVETKPTFSSGRSTVLFPAAGFYSYQFAPQYAVAPDDQGFLMIRSVETSAPDKLIVVENWFEELTAKTRN